MAPTPADLLAAAQRSLQAAGSRDRAGWVGLFADGGRIEDPVGSRPHFGAQQIERFYDTFIGPRQISFRGDMDVVAGTTVIRDLELQVTMAPKRNPEKTGTVTMCIPAYLRYALTPDLRIAELQAYWELPTMVGQFLRSGVAALPAGIQLAGTLLRNQGFAGVVGFAAGFRGPGRAGKRLFTRLLDELCVGNEVAVRRRLAGDVAVHAGENRPLVVSQLIELCAGATWCKPVASGYSVVARLETERNRAVLIADLTPNPLAVGRLRCFVE
ncbi:ketosteroid isomerase family protein [Mycobacterium sp. 155]|uniref:ketosteroid isomerase family protein n=1 Tax=Mycobacterium sp. 155 TaxID=1157943 RepID=UPI0003662DC1|nr:ketosteroid isomerase family protein [Mycobacterium sp. 155]